MPDALAIDSAGNVYVANYGDDSVSFVTANGVVSTFLSGLPGLSGPDALSINNSSGFFGGGLLVANAGNNTVSQAGV